MQRYLVFFSYIGTRLRGIQKQINVQDNPLIPYYNSVQNLLEGGLKKLKPINEPIIIPSSRTDVGVHALCNSAHVDLQHANPNIIYNPAHITVSLNRHFNKIAASLLIQKTFAVSQDFHARYNATGRTYLYRLAICNPLNPVQDVQPTENHLIQQLPITEWKRCHLVSGPFDLTRAQKACQLLQGVHDFASFTGKLNQTKASNPDLITRRTLIELSINPSHPISSWDPAYSNVTFYDVTVHARAFLYRQVRRIVAVLIAVAQGNLSLSDVEYLLEKPSPHSWNPRAAVVPPHGLYLARVHYDPVHFQHEFLSRVAPEKAELSEGGGDASLPL